MDGKSFWASKTFWASAVAVIAAVLSAVGVWDMNAEVQAEVVALVMGVVGMVLRFMTKEPVHL